MPRRRSTVFSCLPNRPWLLKRYYVLLIRCCREKAVQTKETKTNFFVGISNCPCLRAGGKQTRAAAAAMASLQNRRKISGREQGILEGHKKAGRVGGRETDRKSFLPYQAGHGCKKVMMEFFQWPEEPQNTLGTKHTSPESAGKSDHGDALQFLSRVSTPRFQRSDALASCESLPRGLFRL